MTLPDQIACARRELAMRRSAYPGWVRSGKMTQAKADHELACMAAIIDTLERVHGCHQAFADFIQNIPPWPHSPITSGLPHTLQRFHPPTKAAETTGSTEPPTHSESVSPPLVKQTSLFS